MRHCVSDRSHTLSLTHTHIYIYTCICNYTLVFPNDTTTTFIRSFTRARSIHLSIDRVFSFSIRRAGVGEGEWERRRKFHRHLSRRRRRPHVCVHRHVLYRRLQHGCLSVAMMKPARQPVPLSCGGSVRPMIAYASWVVHRVARSPAASVAHRTGLRQAARSSSMTYHDRAVLPVGQPIILGTTCAGASSRDSRRLSSTLALGCSLARRSSWRACRRLACCDAGGKVGRLQHGVVKTED